MHAQLREFLLRLAGTAAMAMVPVVFAAFVSTAPVLEHLGGGAQPVPGAPAEHMT